MLRIPKVAFAIVTALSLCSLPGCLIGASSHTRVSGKHVGTDTLRQIQQGDSKDLVLALCGEPTSKATLDDQTELWKWTFSKETTSRSSMFLLFSSTKEVESGGSTCVMFRNDEVSRVWEDTTG